HVAALGLADDDGLGLPLGPHEDHVLAGPGEPAEEVRCPDEPLQGLPEIDDVDQVTLTEDVGLHLRMPPAHPVSEVHPRLDQILHVRYGQKLSPFVRRSCSPDLTVRAKTPPEGGEPPDPKAMKRTVLRKAVPE